MAFNTAHIGDGRVGDHLVGGSRTSSSTPQIQTNLTDSPFTIQIEDSSYNLKANLVDWESGRITDNLNGVNTITLRYPVEGDSTEFVLLVNPNLLCVRKFGNIKERYIITSTEEDNEYITVEGQSLISVLSDTVESYSASGATVGTIVSSLLALQNSSNPSQIGVGIIQEPILSSTRTIEVKNKSILGAIQDLHKQVGGFFRVDEIGRLYWDPVTTTSTPGHVLDIRYGKNMGNLKIRKNFKKIATRIIAKGKSGLRVQVDDTTRQGEVGVIPKTIFFPHVTKKSTLQDLAENKLNEMKDGTTEITMDALDLSKAQTRHDYAHAEIFVGQTVRITHVDKGVNFTRDLLKASWDLANPVDCQIEVSNPVDSDVTVVSGTQTSKPRRTIITQIAELFGLTNAVADIATDPLDLETSFVDSILNVNNLLETDQHPGPNWRDGERVVTGAGTEPDPYVEHIRKDGSFHIIGPGNTSIDEGDITALGYPPPGDVAETGDLPTAGSTPPRITNAGSAGSAATFSSSDHPH